VTQIINWIRSEPVAIAAVLSIIATLAISLGVANQGTVGAILSAIQAILAVIVRSQVSPTVSVTVAKPTPLP
jgi:hypothetical protein